MKIEEIEAEAAHDYLAREFRFQGATQATLISMVCEQIRAAVYLFTVDSPSNSSVSKLKVVRTVCQKAAPLMPALGYEDGPEDLIRRELHLLTELKDLVEDDELGVSLAPCRLVPVEPGAFLMIGGGPSQSLPSEIRTELQIFGRARVVTPSPRNRQFLESLPKQTAESWLASTGAAPFAWRDAYLKVAARRMAAAVELEHVEAFEGGFFRQLASVRETGKPLFVRFRTNSSFNRFYGLASCVSADGKRVVEKFADIDYDDAQRLRGIWSMDGVPARLEFAKCNGLVELNVGHPLPKPEAQFLSLGWFVESKSQSGWPHHYYFPQFVFPLIEAAAIALGFQMTEVPIIRKNHE
jgi:hypothetical protein